MGHRGEPLFWFCFLHIIGIAMILGGFAMTDELRRCRRIAAAMWGWPAAPGRIVTSYVSEIRSRSSPVTYLPRISYEYQVASETHTGDRIVPALFQATRDATNAEAWVQRLPPHHEVTIYYNPTKPREAVILRESKALPAMEQAFVREAWTLLAIGIGALLIAWIFCNPFSRPSQ